MMKKSLLSILIFLCCSVSFTNAAPAKINVVVLAMYEIGEDSGDIPGELQFWVERYPDLQEIEFAMGRRNIYLNEQDGVLITLTGGGLTHASTTVTALGLDQRFDLSEAYWLIAGIAGGDPEDVSLGSGAWAKWVVDGDLMKEIDGREIPEDWPYGMIPLGAKEPNAFGEGWTVDNIVFQLNENLVDWAYELTKDYPLEDSEGIREFRQQFEGMPNAQTPPTVIIGDALASSTYWHGVEMNNWANDWVKHYSEGEGNFVMTNMEDTGTLTAIQRLTDVGLADIDRVLVLRTASNFSRQPPGLSVEWSTTAPYPDNGLPALEAAYQLGRKVVDSLVEAIQSGKTPGIESYGLSEKSRNVVTDDAPIPIKVVIVTMFERGQDTGDEPAEFQYWVERLPLDEVLEFPQGHRHLRINREKGILGIVTGIGTFKSAASIMALGMDPRFDLTDAYWLVAGIAGVDPHDMSLGSAAWAEWLIDGDLAHEIDIREAPAGWTTGYTPLRSAEPYVQPLPENKEGVRYQLNEGLVDWAYELTKDTALMDNEASAILRARYVNYPNAQKPPFVLKGDQLAAMTFWHGKLMNDWANDWVDYWSEGDGNFVTSAMEETGTMQSLTFLKNAGKVDTQRVLVLRTASNFTMQHKGITAQESLSGERKGGYSAMIPALENAYRVGVKVVDALIDNWEVYKKELPAYTEPES